MGWGVSGILAILFMDKFENIALCSHRFIIPYKQYADNIYLQTTNENTADEFHQTMNSLHPKIEFEIKKPTTSIYLNGLSLSLLDFTITISDNGESSFEFYKNTAKINSLRPPCLSATQEFQNQLYPQQIDNAYNRAGCSTQTTSKKHDHAFDNVFCANGYPEYIILETKNRANTNTNHKNNTLIKISCISRSRSFPRN